MAISVNVSSPAAISNLDELKSTVSDWLDRDDLDDRIPTFILMAEATFNRELRTPEMEKSATGSMTAEDNALPSDFLAMRAIYIESSPDLPLKAMSPTSLRQEFDGSADTPVAYALVSGGIRFAPPPAAPFLVTMDYFGSIEGLSVTSPSNWLLEQHPDAYLYGTLYFAEAFLDNSTRASQWKMLLDQTILKINGAARDNRYGAGPLVPNTVTQVHGSRC